MVVFLFCCTFWNFCLCTALLCFSLYGYTTTTMVSSFLYYILGTGSSSFLVLVLFFLLYLFFYTPHTTLFLADVTLHVFHLSFKEKPLFSVFIGLNSLAFISPIVYISYHHLLCDPFSLKQEHIL